VNIGGWPAPWVAQTLQNDIWEVEFHTTPLRDFLFDRARTRGLRILGKPDWFCSMLLKTAQK